jgi:hypothetical protein
MRVVSEALTIRNNKILSLRKMADDQDETKLVLDAHKQILLAVYSYKQNTTSRIG